jgi:hypothetical protein
VTKSRLRSGEGSATSSRSGHRMSGQTTQGPNRRETAVSSRSTMIHNPAVSPTTRNRGDVR